MGRAARKSEKAYYDAFWRTIERPQWFFENIMLFNLFAWQYRLINAALDVPRFYLLGIDPVTNIDLQQRVTVRSCHGTGKTQGLAALMHIWSFLFYSKIACTAPKEMQLTKRLMPRYRKMLNGAVPEYANRIKTLGKEIVIENDPDWGAIMETASDPDNLAGYHDTPQLFLIDEGSAKRLDPMYPVIEGALTTPGSVSVEIGNPTRMEGEFYSHHCKKGVKDLYYKMHIKPEDAPEIISQEWLDTMLLKYGKDSPIYKIRALGEFAAYDDYTLIYPSWFEDALDLPEETDGSIPKLRISIDVSDGGADTTVLTAANKYDSFDQILKQKSLYVDSGKATDQIVAAAINLFEALGGNKQEDDFVVDGLGVGAGVVSGLNKRGYLVVNYKGSETEGIDRKRFRNRRVQSYITLYEDFRDGRIRFSPDCFDTDADEERLRYHLSLIKRPKNSIEVIDDIEPKRKIREDALESPDCADSLAMQKATQLPEEVSGFEMPVLVGEMSEY